MPQIESCESFKLTSLSSCAGCAAKIGQQALREVLGELPQFSDERLLVGSATSDDAAVYRLDEDRALVQTVDFFTPIVDDPEDYGRVAATNALSDVYAMGGKPITALNLVGMPTDKLPPDVIHRILEGGAAKVKEAGCCLVGGHSIKTPEPIYGLSVTGLVDLNRMMTNANARPGDYLLLTKPLGTGVATTGLKRGKASATLEREVTRLMSTLNRVGHELASRGLVRAATDVTGFGLLGHLGSMCRASGVGARIDAAAVPVISEEILRLIDEGCIPGGTSTNLSTARDITDFNGPNEAAQILLADAQTSGGLLLCVGPDRLEAVHDILIAYNTPAQARIGRIIESPTPRIVVE